MNGLHPRLLTGLGLCAAGLLAGCSAGASSTPVASPSRTLSTAATASGSPSPTVVPPSQSTPDPTAGWTKVSSSDGYTIRYPPMLTVYDSQGSLSFSPDPTKLHPGVEEPDGVFYFSCGHNDPVYNDVLATPGSDGTTTISSAVIDGVPATRAVGPLGASYPGTTEVSYHLLSTRWRCFITYGFRPSSGPDLTSQLDLMVQRTMTFTTS
jgi:hypothetical protein